MLIFRKHGEIYVDGRMIMNKKRSFLSTFCALWEDIYLTVIDTFTFCSHDKFLTHVRWCKCWHILSLVVFAWSPRFSRDHVTAWQSIRSLFGYHFQMQTDCCRSSSKLWNVAKMAKSRSWPCLPCRDASIRSLICSGQSLIFPWHFRACPFWFSFLPVW